jgi:sugar phosphate isomerase/epimerase
MSTTQPDGIEGTLRSCRPAEIEPVVIDAADLDSTAPEHLRDLKTELSTRGYQPATLSVEACFDCEDALAAQREADRLREYVRAASFLGAGRIEVRLGEVADPTTAEPALSALTERARREGVELVRVDGGATAA